MAPHVHGPLTASECIALAGALGERSEFTIARHHLLRHSCTAYCVGEPTAPVAALVQPYDAIVEPTGTGSDARALLALLQVAQGWACVEVERTVADALADLLSTRSGQPCRLYGSVYYTLTQPANICEHPHVRLLTPDDLPLLTAAPEDLQGTGFGGPEGLLRQGALAAAIVEGQVVATAFTVAITPHHAEIGVETLNGYRRRGYATAAASLVARWVQSRGLTPTWSTGEDNLASQRVAEKVGFVQCLERAYVIPVREQPTEAESLAEIDAWTLPNDERPLPQRLEAMVRPSLWRGLFGQSATMQVSGLQYHLCGADDTRQLAQLASLSSSDHVLDVACFLGGPAVQLVLEHGCRVTGIDRSPLAIAGARRIATLTGLGERLRFEVADATRLPFADASFDVVWNQASLYHQEAWLEEMARVLKPGGRLAITFDARPGMVCEGTPRWSLEEMAAQWGQRGLRTQHLEDLLEREIVEGWGGLLARLDVEEEAFAAVFGHAWVSAARAEFAQEIKAMRAGRWTNGRMIAIKE